MNDMLDVGECPGKIIQKEIPVSEEDFPAEALGRTRESEIISRALSAFSEGKEPENMFIYGPAGTGKTTTIRKIISGIDRSKLIPVYVNCHEYNTKNSIFSKISDELGNTFSRRGFSSCEIVRKIKESCEKENIGILLVLDSFGSVQKNHAHEILYPILEENGFRSSCFSIIAVSDHFSTFERLDARIKSSFLFHVVEFEPYPIDAILTLLLWLASYAFSKGSCDVPLLKKISELAASSEGNAKFAVWLLVSAAKKAEFKGKRIIDLKDIEEVYESILPVITDPSVYQLPKEEQLIISILKFGEKNSTQIYDLFLKNSKRSKRHVRNHLASLITKGMIESEEIPDGNSFIKPRIYRLKR